MQHDAESGNTRTRLAAQSPTDRGTLRSELDYLLERIEQRAMAFCVAPTQRNEHRLDRAVQRTHQLVADTQNIRIDPNDWQNAINALEANAVRLGEAIATERRGHVLVEARRKKTVNARRRLEELVAPILDGMRQS